MKIFTRAATGLAAAVATAVVISMVPAAEAAPAGSASTSKQAPAASAIHGSTLSLQAAKAGKLTSRVNGTFHHGQGKVHGTFVPKRFLQRGDRVFAYGVLHATLRKADGSLKGRTTKAITIPIKNGSASKAKLATCQVLDLVLGPLDLNLLGLKVHLNRVVLNIVAVSGAGALLGNLICAVAGLLDGTGLLNLLKLTNKLNQILNVLRL